jgi:hypothetical protein
MKSVKVQKKIKILKKYLSYGILEAKKMYAVVKKRLVALKM